MSETHTRVLLIDDSDDVRNALRLGLELFDYEVEDCATGREGLKRFSLSKPDVTIIDLRLPDIGGFEVAKKIRELSSDSLLFLLTGVDGNEARENAKAAGFNRFIVKPIKFSELTSLIEESMNQRAAQ
ncbi:MAG: response regulator [Mariniblastus sp.]